MFCSVTCSRTPSSVGGELVSQKIECNCGFQQAYALPALFCLKLSGPRLPLPRWQALVCYGLIPVAVALSGVGLASSLTDLYQKLAHRFL